MALRWDETWKRLLEWTDGQGPSERLSAQILIADGFSNIDPSHPLGGKDGGKDIRCSRDGKRWVCAVYFPRGQQEFRDIKGKFLGDLEAAKHHKPDGFVFVSNQELRLAERRELAVAWPDGEVLLHHLESVTAILDRPAMREVRKQFLAIDWDDGVSGGGGGDAFAFVGGNAEGGAGGDAGRYGSGGRGGNALAEGERSVAVGGPGGSGGLSPGGPGGEAHAKGGLSFGGEGGGANRHDGRAGKPGRSGGELAGFCGSFGQGGRGCNTAAYEGKQVTIRRLLWTYYSQEPPPELAADFNLAVPIEWLNEQLALSGRNWRVAVDQDGEFEFTVVPSSVPVVPHVPGKFPPLPALAVEGIALMVCHRIEHPAGHAERLIGLFDIAESKSFPHAVGAFAVYLLMAGQGTVRWSLTLEAPSGEVLVARSGSADQWGVIGAHEVFLAITDLVVRETGIHWWRFRNGDTLLLERPLLVRATVESQA